MQTFTRDKTEMVFDRQIEPIGRVKNAEVFVVETADSACGLVKHETDTFSSFEDMLERAGGACPVTGPIYLDGARPGDCVAMTIEDIRAAPRSGEGWTMIVPGWGGLTNDMGYGIQDPLPPVTAICTVGAEDVEFNLDGHRIRLPTEPFLGTVGVAPVAERRMTLSQSRDYLGDVDIRAIGNGAKLILPVHVEGALLSMGDAHAAQGEGEITGIAVEVEADVRVHLDVLGRDEARMGMFPILETDEMIGVVVGQMGVSLTQCIRGGYTDLVRRLQRYHGYSREAAYILVGQAGVVRIGNLIDPFYSCYVALPRHVLAE